MHTRNSREKARALAKGSVFQVSLNLGDETCSLANPVAPVDNQPTTYYASEAIHDQPTASRPAKRPPLHTVFYIVLKSSFEMFYDFTGYYSILLIFMVH